MLITQMIALNYLENLYACIKVFGSTQGWSVRRLLVTRQFGGQSTHNQYGDEVRPVKVSRVGADPATVVQR